MRHGSRLLILLILKTSLAYAEVSFDTVREPASETPDVQSQAPFSVTSDTPEDTQAIQAQEEEEKAHLAALEARRLKKKEKLLPWRNVFVGLRVSTALGDVQVPAYSSGSYLASNSLQFGPYLGLELGYTSGNWGAGITFDGGMLLPPSYLTYTPIHLLAGFQISYISDPRTRWIFGFDPWSSYRAYYTTNDSMTVEGYGFRIGVHRYLSPIGDPGIELFGYLCVDRLIWMASRFNGNTQVYRADNVVGQDLPMRLAYIMFGMQISLSY